MRATWVLTVRCQLAYATHMRPDPPADDWTQFATAAFALNALLIEAGETIVAPMGQSSARWQVLGRAHHPTTVADMARDIGHARQSVQRIADVLVREGLLEFRPHDRDRRTQLVGLTPGGEQMLEAIYSRQLAWSDDVVVTIGPSRLAAATESLTSITEALRTAIAPAPQQKESL
ncbi:winged helix-turn-helix transcriptional regulator [Glaciibacter flavus]|uniref:Winged helix-turn-helix transcriptional regulator n=2 Tax=Orlajensenia flava TaxID=2565934 RepID=A0A4S4FNN3_9MICO|nr:winged helix-turn-helix transcriptional regulator [Glaciibacter flavus]THG32089.1 winged helix-turn-helix transcriptional regulator [Glaciibacter flavus]